MAKIDIPFDKIECFIVIRDNRLCTQCINLPCIIL